MQVPLSNKPTFLEHVADMLWQLCEKEMCKLYYFYLVIFDFRKRVYGPFFHHRPQFLLLAIKIITLKRNCYKNQYLLLT